MSKNLIKSENFTRNDKGQSRYAKGNKIGRMKKKGFSLTDLNKVVVEYEKTHSLPLLKHYINQLFTDNNLLGKYIDKNVPTRTVNELTGADGSPLTFIVEKSYNNDKPKEEEIENKQE